MNNRLYVGNLSFHTTEETLQGAFANCGQVTEVRIMLDRETGRSRGFGFVVMGNESEAKTAISQMNGVELDGRQLRVNEAEQRRDRPGGGGGGFGGGGGGGGFGGDRGGDRDRGGGRGGRDRGGRGGDRW